MLGNINTLYDVAILLPLKMSQFIAHSGWDMQGFLFDVMEHRVLKIG